MLRHNWGKKTHMGNMLNLTSDFVSSPPYFASARQNINIFCAIKFSYPDIILLIGVLKERFLNVNIKQSLSVLSA